MVEIYITEINGKLPLKQWEYYLGLLPVSEQMRNRRFLRWEDQHAHLFGKILLNHALIKYGFTGNVLNLVRYNDYQKPFIDDHIHFNISHSGRFIGCAISKEIKLGLDIEQKKSGPEIPDFKDIFSQPEWELLNCTAEKDDWFYKLWTRKESVIKANGRGLTIPLHEVNVLGESVCIENNIWYIKDLELDVNYSASLATNTTGFSIQFVPVNYYES